MRIIFFGLIPLVTFLLSCKKKGSESETEPESALGFDGSAPGKIKSINNGYYSFKYTEEGLLSEYKYNSSGVMKTATLTWAANQVTCDDGQPYHFVRPRDINGYALPGTQDNSAANSWTYNSLHNVTNLNGTNYYWSNGNVDSLILSGMVTICEYSTSLDNRNFGANFVPLLTNFPVHNIPNKNLKIKHIQLNLQRDTVSIRTFTHLLDASGRVIKETEYEHINGSAQYISERNYEYY